MSKQIRTKRPGYLPGVPLQHWDYRSTEVPMLMSNITYPARKGVMDNVIVGKREYIRNRPGVVQPEVRGIKRPKDIHERMWRDLREPLPLTPPNGIDAWGVNTYDETIVNFGKALIRKIKKAYVFYDPELCKMRLKPYNRTRNNVYPGYGKHRAYGPWDNCPCIACAMNRNHEQYKTELDALIYKWVLKEESKGRCVLDGFCVLHRTHPIRVAQDIANGCVWYFE